MYQRRKRAPRHLLVALVAGAVLAGTAVPAAAAPPTNPTDGQIDSAESAREKAAAEVGRIIGLVSDAKAELDRLSYQAEAANAAYMQAEGALAQAQAAADRTAARLASAGRKVAAAENRIADFSRDRYINGATLTSTAALLDSAGPGELIRRAAMLDWVADNQVDVLGQLEVAKVQQANADSAARQARDEMAAAEAAAEAAKAAADRQVAAQMAAYDAVAVKKAEYDKQLRRAQIELLRLQGARNAYESWQRQQAAMAAAKRAEEQRREREAAEAARRAREGSGRDEVTGGGGGYVKPFSGVVTSCFGSRWGSVHYGLDVASRIGTPLYAPTSGVVRRAGPATGFGLAVYLQADDGTVFVYGHINDYFVYAGQRVSAGQRIAEVGNTGLSTGPHVHFEVHPGGDLYSGAVNPVPWLNARGISAGGCGG